MSCEVYQRIQILCMLYRIFDGSELELTLKLTEGCSGVTNVSGSRSIELSEPSFLRTYIGAHERSSMVIERTPLPTSKVPSSILVELAKKICGCRS